MPPLGSCCWRSMPPHPILPPPHLQATLSKMHAMDSLQLSFVAHAMSCVAWRPDAYWLARFAEQCTPRLVSMRPRELSNILRAAARWQVDFGECRALPEGAREGVPLCWWLLELSSCAPGLRQLQLPAPASHLQGLKVVQLPCGPSGCSCPTFRPAAWLPRWARCTSCGATCRPHCSTHRCTACCSWPPTPDCSKTAR